MQSFDPSCLFWPTLETKPLKVRSVPKVIHQMWLGGNPPMNLINTWKEQNPEWKHILWTEQSLKNWRFHNQEKLDLMPELNGKCDIMRYEILYHMGGFFVDADSICLRPLDDELFQFDCTSVYESEKQRGGLVACGFMASQPRCELLKLCIDELNKVMSPAWWYVGPAYFTHIIQKYKYPIKIHPSYAFIPRHYTGLVYKGRGDVYCDHLWGVTHPEGYERFKLYKPVQAAKPKSQRRQLRLQGHHSCRRLSILCQCPYTAPDQQPYLQLPQNDRSCNRAPKSATQIKKIRVPS